MRTDQLLTMRLSEFHIFKQDYRIKTAVYCQDCKNVENKLAFSL